MMSELGTDFTATLHLSPSFTPGKPGFRELGAKKTLLGMRKGALFESREAVLLLALGTTRKKLQPARMQFQPAG